MFVRGYAAAIAAGALLLSSSGFAKQNPQIVYGNDDRVAVATEFERGRAVAALIPWEFLRADDSTLQYFVRAPTVSETFALCPGERLADEPAAAICTGVLVGVDVLLTAGHCALPRICDDYAIVFDYTLNDRGEVAPIPASSVFACQNIIRRELPNKFDQTSADYGWLRFAHPIERAPVAPLRCDSVELDFGDTVSMLGFPLGTPLKLHERGTVYDDGGPDYQTFISSLDASHGNSGAPVFDESGHLAGILGEGGYDTYPGPDDCELTHVVPDSAEYAEEKSTYACVALDGFCERVEDRHELCGAACRGFCDDDPSGAVETPTACAVASVGPSAPIGWVALVAGLIAFTTRRSSAR